MNEKNYGSDKITVLTSNRNRNKNEIKMKKKKEGKECGMTIKYCSKSEMLKGKRAIKLTCNRK